MAKSVYIVTGATGGIGKAIVEELCDRLEVETVILACRNVEKASLLAAGMKAVCPDKEILAMPLDLESFASVKAFARDIIVRGWTVKALIHNAGTMPSDVRVTDDGFESATQTNFMSPVLLTELLADRLCPGGSVVFTTSMTRRIARFSPGWRSLSINRHNRFVTYGRSKKMLTAYALMLSERLHEAGVRVNCSDPWIVDTGMITMGNRFVDWLSRVLFRPLVYTPRQGAESAIAALDTKSTARIFTLKHSADIPLSYGSEDIRKLIGDACRLVLH